MITLLLEQVGFGVFDIPEGNSILRFQDEQSGIAVNIPLDPSARLSLAKQLQGNDLVVAHSTVEPAILDERRAKK